MQTLNISLPEKLSLKVDEVVEEEGYASRSEFFRTLLRLYLQLVEAKPKRVLPFLVPFRKQPLSKVKKEMEATGLYKKEFVKSVISGLSQSSLYANQTPKS